MLLNSIDWSRWRWKARSASAAFDTLRLTVVMLLSFTARAHAWETVCSLSIPATMVDSVDSATAYPGMGFRFKITSDVNFFGTIIPQDATGYGYVVEVSGASNRDRNGSLILDMRSIEYNNRFYQVMIDPRDSTTWAPATTIGERASDYLPIPGIVRTAVNEVRDGKNITIGPGFHFRVIALGDPRKYQPCRKVGQ